MEKNISFVSLLYESSYKECHPRQLHANVHMVAAVKCDNCVPSCTKNYKSTESVIKTCNHLQ